MSTKYNGPDDWTIFHIADDRTATYTLKNSGTANSSSNTAPSTTAPASSSDNPPTTSRSTTKPSKPKTSTTAQ